MKNLKIVINIKKVLLVVLGITLFIRCSPDSMTSSEIESTDLSRIINPDTARAAAEFDNTSSGIYRGVFVSNDIAYHGVLTVNLANDSQYNAILEYGDNQSQRMGFVRVNNGPTSVSNVIEFRGSNAGFTLNVSDYNQPIVTEGYVDGQGAQIKLFKETSTNRVMTTLGVYFDELDPLYRGAWDLISTSTRVISMPTGLPLPFPQTVDVTVNNITGYVVTRDAATWVDTSNPDDFNPGLLCGFVVPTFPIGPQAPWFSGIQNVEIEPGISMNINEYAAGTQTMTLNPGEPDANFSLVYSKKSGDKYYDINCLEAPLGGTWSWKGRSGHILLLL